MFFRPRYIISLVFHICSGDLRGKGKWGGEFDGGKRGKGEEKEESKQDFWKNLTDVKRE